MKKIASCLLNPTDYGFEIKDNIWKYHLYVLGVNTGLRVGEIFSLKKSNYIAGESKILVNSTLSRRRENDKAVYYDSNKTKNKTQRYLKLNSQAKIAVEYFLTKNTENSFLVSSPDKKSGFMLPSIARDMLHQVCTFLAVPYIGSHGAFRKTFATQIALTSNKNFKDKVESIQLHLGHKSPQMTMHYIQAIDTNLDDELELLSDIF